MRLNKKTKGFTLIELLVVISIIGVLSTVVITSLNEGRARARDAKREQDIISIQNALELYYVDNGRYPINGWAVSNSSSSWENFEILLGTSLPSDPVNESGYVFNGALTYGYYSANTSKYCYGQAYMLVFSKETSNGTGPNDGVKFCDGSTTTYGNRFVVGVTPME